MRDTSNRSSSISLGVGGPLFLVLAGPLVGGQPQQSIECHKRTTPGIVTDWQLGKHAENAVSFDTCHGVEHQTVGDFDKVRIPTPESCASCHAAQFEQFKKGRHAHGWVAMKAMPTAHAQPVAMMEG